VTQFNHKYKGNRKHLSYTQFSWEYQLL